MPNDKICVLNVIVWWFKSSIASDVVVYLWVQGLLALRLVRFLRPGRENEIIHPYSIEKPILTYKRQTRFSRCKYEYQKCPAAKIKEVQSCFTGKRAPSSESALQRKFDALWERGKKVCYQFVRTFCILILNTNANNTVSNLRWFEVTSIFAW